MNQVMSGATAVIETRALRKVYSEGTEAEVVAHRLQDIDERLERVTLELLPLSPDEQARLKDALQVPGEEEIVSTALQIARRLQEARDEGRRRAAAVDPSLATSGPARPLHGANSAPSHA